MACSSHNFWTPAKILSISSMRFSGLHIEVCEQFCDLPLSIACMSCARDPPTVSRSLTALSTHAVAHSGHGRHSPVTVSLACPDSLGEMFPETPMLPCDIGSRRLPESMLRKSAAYKRCMLTPNTDECDNEVEPCRGLFCPAELVVTGSLNLFF